MILPYQDYRPKIHPTAYVAPSADLIGCVELHEDSSIWFGSVLRADINKIVIGKGSNIQDGSILHVDDDNACVIADNVHVGHHVNLHGCRVETGAMVGIGAIVLSGVRIGKESIIGAGSVVLEGSKIPPRSLVVGTPAKVVRQVTEKDLKYVRHWAQKYVRLAAEYRTGLRDVPR